VGLRDTKVVEIRQDLIYSRLLACILTIAGILILTAFQQTNLGLLGLILFPFLFLPGFLLAVISLVLTMDFSCRKLTISSKILWIKTLKWTTRTLDQRDVTLLKVRKMTLISRFRIEKWHYKISILNEGCKYLFFTSDGEFFKIMKRFLTLED
jgi:hypothetical protein